MNEYDFQTDAELHAKLDIAARRILGVSDDANIEEIKTAFRKLAKKYHPDVVSDLDSEYLFKNIVNAYEFLTKGKNGHFNFLRNALQNNNATEEHSQFPEDDYNLDNLWGYFLSWRDRFF